MSPSARKLKAYSRLYSWKQLLFFKLNDVVTRWAEHRSMRRTRSLRIFSYTVPPESVTLRDGEFHFSYPVNDTPMAFTLRRDSSDVSVFLQVVAEAEYLDVARLIGTRGRPARIVDVGANIGLTTLYFKAFHKDAQIVALEPEPTNYEMLARAVEGNALKDVVLFNEGLWTKETRVAPDWSFRDGLAWSFTLKEAPEGSQGAIRVTTLDSLLARVGWDAVDVLKIDIEGGEAKLVRDPSFLATLAAKVGVVCMEVHEEVISRAEVQAALASIGMTSVNAGGTLIAWRGAAAR